MNKAGGHQRIARRAQHGQGRQRQGPPLRIVRGRLEVAPITLDALQPHGGLFTHVLAFSPGFMAPARTEDSPRFFVSHGLRDTVLPIDRTSRRIVPRLEVAGYEVAYREFPDGHTVPPEIARDALAWFLGG